MKKRVFVAYCSKQEHVAKKIQAGLKRNFDLVLWSEAKWSGGVILDNIFNEIHRCDYGLALLSCDDECHAGKKKSWLPRNNVTLELGYFLRHYKQARTAIVRVKEPDGRTPRFPSDLRGWLDIRVSSSPSATSIKEACEKISARFEGREADIILSINPRGSAKSGFNVLTIEDALRKWGEFEGHFFCVNPSWNLEHNNASWRRAHAVRYLNPKFLSANYVVDIDRGRDANALDGETIGKTRIYDETHDLTGIIRFADRIIRDSSNLARLIEKKMRIHIRPGVRSELTSFVGTLDRRERGFLFVRRLTDNTVLEAQSPQDVAKMSDRIHSLIGGRKHFKLSEARALRDRLVHS